MQMSISFMRKATARLHGFRSPEMALSMALTAALLCSALFNSAVAQSQTYPAGTPASGPGPEMRGMGSWPGGARGLIGSVIEAAADHYTIRTESGETYVVHFSVNTRIMKQPAGRRPAGGEGAPRQGRSREDSARENGSGDAERQMPQPLKPSEIKVGDFITAGGEVDSAQKSVGAIFILQIDPERARQLREMQANYGKTWLAGRITVVDGTRITIDGLVDHAPHSIEVDENTSFRKRRESITLADLQPGEQLRAEGAVRNGVFLASIVHSMGDLNAASAAPAAPGPVAPAPK